jgi:molybdopterin converting factor small subunit
VSYGGQAREAAGCAAEELEADSAAALLAAAAGRHEALRPMLLRSDGRPHPSVLVIVGDEQRRGDDPRPIPPGVPVTLLTPLSGG